ncbi:src-like-adapter isoform X1 [Myxocyprinus asiaticus]|uniref:src-like-adapter isoform X1 n=1 Tax=Myxocyprinus asiaticus TaxID=70543 RepID=UPI002221BB79|nr:src-like-adapter isoform X1 [Myxocyprinus asiaticus]XP_051519335.1 src-like-adapter isoform X1 [Myxocyprinus asiaticus]
MGNAMKIQEEKNKVPNSLETVSKDCDSLVVLSDYPCRDISEPIFKMGDKLKGLSEDGCWWKVRSLQTGTENYIPSNHVAKVYHGWLFEGVGRQKAEELLSLAGNGIGSFLIRESPRERSVYSLSVRHRTIKHYKIFRLNNSWYYISPRLTFQCLEDMVNHYCDSSDGLCCVLSAPCLALSKPAPSSTQEAPPVVMRHNLDWKKVNRSQLMSPGGLGLVDNKDNMMSYGVRSSIATYLSLTSEPEQSKDRNKKSKSVYVMPDHSSMDIDENC